MQKEWISVRTHGKTLDCNTVILVSERALDTDGQIIMLSSNTGPQTKHEFYALAQMAFIQFQDDELDISAVQGPIKVAWKDAVNQIEAGMAICRARDGTLSVMAHHDQPWRKLLEAAHRYCTRWIRMDVR